MEAFFRAPPTSVLCLLASSLINFSYFRPCVENLLQKAIFLHQPIKCRDDVKFVDNAVLLEPLVGSSNHIPIKQTMWID